MACAFCASDLAWQPWSCEVCSPGVGYLCSDCGKELAASAEDAQRNKKPRLDAEAAVTSSAEPCTNTAHSFSSCLSQAQRSGQGWLVFCPRGGEGDAAALQRFLAASPPSTAPSTALQWIAVRAPPAAGAQEAPLEDIDLQGLQESWHALLDGLPFGEQPTVDQVLALGEAHNVTCGKWLVYASTAAVDAIWAALARLVVLPAGGAAGLTSAAKVSPPESRNSHRICVYADDFRRKVEWEALGAAVEDALRPLRPKGYISFKPDVFTHLDIYSRNPWKLKPTLTTRHWG